MDDDAANLAAIEVALGDLGRHLVKAGSGREALKVLLEREFSLILLDVQMPGMDGFETARMIRDRPRSRHIPIIFVTAYSRDDADILKGYELGAVDFLFKPIVPEVLRAKAAVLVALQQRTAQVLRQAEKLREMERREAERRLEEERQRWEAEALREENRRKDEFLAVLAHELRNPMAPMVTGLELIRQYGIEHKGLERVRSSMERQVKHLVRLVDDLLDVSRISQGKVTLQREPVELCDMVSQAIESVKPLVEQRRHELVFEGAEEALPVLADPVRLTQVVANLLNNAARYTDEGGRLRVSCGRDGDEAVLRVADNGRGISAEMLERIFEMFVQERDEGKGLGLGLTLVHQLVEAHGGRVRAFSAGPGKGSEFVVRLPICEDAAEVESAEVPDAPAEAAAEQALDIVIVEDETDVRLALSELLTQWGHRVEVADNGRDGLAAIVAGRPDVALIDIAMPELDGYTVARQVRQELGPGGPRLVALTGFGRAEDRERARRAGFHAHLVKPAAPQDLRRVLRGGSDGASDEYRDTEKGR